MAFVLLKHTNASRCIYIYALMSVSVTVPLKPFGTPAASFNWSPTVTSCGLMAAVQLHSLTSLLDITEKCEQRCWLIGHFTWCEDTQHFCLALSGGSWWPHCGNHGDGWHMKKPTRIKEKAPQEQKVLHFSAHNTTHTHRSQPCPLWTSCQQQSTEATNSFQGPTKA